MTQRVYSRSGQRVQHCAGSSGPRALRLCRFERPFSEVRFVRIFLAGVSSENNQQETDFVVAGG
jgi:hypothetical protein